MNPCTGTRVLFVVITVRGERPAAAKVARYGEFMRTVGMDLRGTSWVGAHTYTPWNCESSREVGAVSVSEEPEVGGVPLSDGSPVWLSAALPTDELEPIEPDEIVIRVTDDRAIVFASPNETKHSRWGRW